MENLSPTQDCTTIPATTPATVYFGPVEVRSWKIAGAEQVITYPHPNVKLTNGVKTFMHRDALGSVRAITDAAGVKIESAVYKPFGEQSEWLSPTQPAPETKGWIGERYDADAGLQYLNARYYDPVLGMFLQPDWFEVMQPGVGTNRFSYSFNDPVNKFDPGGNCTNDSNCKGEWDEKESEKAEERQSEDAVADASIYQKKDRYVLDPKKLKLDELLDLGSALQRYINSGTSAFAKSSLAQAISKSIATGNPADFEVTGLSVKVSLYDKVFTEAGSIYGDIQVNITGSINAVDGHYAVTNGVAEINPNEKYNFNEDADDAFTNYAIGRAAARPNWGGVNPIITNPRQSLPQSTSHYGDANIVTPSNRVYQFEAWGSIP